MTNPVLIKRASPATTGRVPLTTDIVLGELAINTYDGYLFLKKNNGSDVIVRIGDQTLTGDITGSGNGTIATTLATVNSNIGTFTKVTVNAKGLVTAASALLSADVTGALGFTPYNSTNPSNYITSAGAPVQSVAGRTGAVVLAVADVSGAAPLASPIFTGTPVTPTPASGDSSTQIANTLYVQASINGALSKSVAGGTNVTLSAVEAGNGIFLLTGTLTASIQVIFPNSAKTFIVSNRTAGAFGVTVKTSTGTGVVVAQGYTSELYSDGTNIVASLTDFTNVALLGVPTTPTALSTDNSTTVASTGYVKSQNYITSAGAPVQSVAGRGGAVVLTVTDVSGAAPSASPILTGTPAAPTATAGTSTSQIATTQFVTAAITAAATGVSSFNTRVGAITLTSADVTGALTFTPANQATVGVASGIATLDATGKLTTAQIPASLVGAVVYQGTWNASTNTPTLTSGSSTKGYYYKVSVTGSTALDGISSWNAGDTVIFDGTTWDKIDGIANEVLSVFGRTGVVVLAGSDVTTALGFIPYNSTNPSNYITSAGAPVQSVAGRTGAVVLAVADVSGAAPLASPTLTGIPLSTTATAGTSTTQIATTSFVQAVAAGTVSVSVAGGVPVNLTADQAATGIIILTGVITANIQVVTPATTSRFVLANRTTGVFTITVKTSTGTGVVVAQGYSTQLYCDGTNVLPVVTDFTSIALQGVPTAPTPATADSSSTVATTAYVKAQGYITSGGAPVQSVAGRTGAVVLAVADVSGAAPLASPVLTGTPTAPTAATADSSTTLATTAFVKAQAYITSAGAPVQSVAGRTGAVVLTTADVSGTIDGGTY